MASHKDSAHKSLPPKRAEGEAPRSFAEDALPLSGPASEGEPRLMKPPAELLSRSPKTALPSQRHADRPMPALTPAVYQAETVAKEKPLERAVLPARRAEDTAPRLKHRAETPAEMAPTPAIVLEGETVSAPSLATSPAHARLAPDNVPKFRPFKGSPVDDRALAQWDRAASQRGQIWITCLVLAVLGAAGWFGVKYLESVTSETAASALSEKVLAAQQVAAQFLQTTTLEQRLALVRHPEVTEGRMRAWHSVASRPLQPLEIERFVGSGEEIVISGRPFVICQPVLAGLGPRALALEETAAGFRVDWESFVNWSEPSWTEFTSQASTEPGEFRVSVTPDDHFGHAYENAEEYYCFQVADPENKERLWVYAPIDSEIGHSLNLLIRRCRQQGADHAKAILRLRFDEAGRRHRQALVEAVVQDGWILP